MLQATDRPAGSRQWNDGFERKEPPGKGPGVHRDRDLAHLEGTLLNGDDQTVATATATGRVIALAEAQAVV